VNRLWRIAPNGWEVRGEKWLKTSFDQNNNGRSLKRVASSLQRNSAAGNSTATKPTSVETVANRSFIDTNVLVYAEASDAPDKQQTALALLKQLYETGTGVLSDLLNPFALKA
jgi:hypothetical protein